MSYTHNKPLLKKIPIFAKKINMRTLIFLMLLFFLPKVIFAQAIDLPKAPRKFYFYWGYNRGVYGKSTIKYHGPGYDFTVFDVKAKDLPEPFSFKVYFDPGLITIPQFNFRFGYHWKNNIYFSVGWDHMKYQSIDDQVVVMDGYVEESASQKFAGVYNHKDVIMDHQTFLRMEHSDGFNLVKINVEKHFDIFSKARDRISMTAMTGTGPIFPLTWTNAILLGKHNDDRPHFSGLGISVFGGARLTFWNRVFFQYNLDVGYVNAWDITTRPKGQPDRASQKIKYFQKMGVVGFTFNLKSPTIAPKSR